MTKDKIDILIIICTFNRIFYAFYLLVTMVCPFQMIFLASYLIVTLLGLFPRALRHPNVFIYSISRALIFKFIHEFHDESIYLYFSPYAILKSHKIIHLKIIYEI